MKIKIVMEFDLVGDESNLAPSWLERIPDVMFTVLRNADFHLSANAEAEPFRYAGGGKHRTGWVEGKRCGTCNNRKRLPTRFKGVTVVCPDCEVTP